MVFTTKGGAQQSRRNKSNANQAAAFQFNVNDVKITPTVKPCVITSIKRDDIRRAKMSCGCGVCAFGMLGYLKNVLESDHLKNQAVCPKCKVIWDWDLCCRVSGMSKQQYDQYIAVGYRIDGNNDNDVDMPSKKDSAGWGIAKTAANTAASVGNIIMSGFGVGNNDSKQTKQPKPKTKNKNNRRNSPPPPKKAKLRETAGLAGLQNLGNTCFLNSALQCALQTPILVPYFRAYNISNSYHAPLSTAWAKLVKNSYYNKPWKNSYSIIHEVRGELSKLKHCIGGGKQEDAFVALSTLLDGLDDENCDADPAVFDMDFRDPSKEPPQEMINYVIENKVWKPHIDDGQAIIRALFDGVECERLKCIKCNHHQLTFQSFRGINLPLIDHSATFGINVFAKNDVRPFMMRCELSNESTIKSLKILILNQLQSRYDKFDASTDDVKIGYLKPSKTTGSNKWVKYLKDDGNCTNITRGLYPFAVVSSNSINRTDDDDEKVKSGNSGYGLIPRFMVILDEKGKQTTIKQAKVENFSFVSFPVNRTFSGNEIIDYAKQSIPKEHTEEYNIRVFHNDRVVLPNFTVKTSTKSSLVIIWYKKNPNHPLQFTVNQFKFDPTEIDILIASSTTNTKNLSIHSIAQSLKNLLESAKNQIIISYLQTLLPSAKINSNVDVEYIKRVESVSKKYAALSEQMNEVEEAGFDALYTRWEKLAPKFQPLSDENKQNARSAVPNNVQQCFKMYEAADISDCHSLDCEQCGESEVVERRVDVLKTPQILMLHIDRDDNNAEPLHKRGQRSNKVQHLIDYPLKDMRFKDDKYDLFAVCIHRGSTENWGHYTAMVKSLHNGNWYLMNDNAEPRRINNKNQIVSNDATILMYRKQIEPKQY